MSTVAQLLQNKGHLEVWSVGPEDDVLTALKLMAEKNIGAVMVFDGSDMVGIFSERDYARRVILAGKSHEDTLIREIMTPNVLGVRPDQNVDQCMALMRHHKLRHLAVMEGGKVTGIISVSDVVNALIAEHKFIIKQLENYIHGR